MKTFRYVLIRVMTAAPLVGVPAASILLVAKASLGMTSNMAPANGGSSRVITLVSEPCNS